MKITAVMLVALVACTGTSDVATPAEPSDPSESVENGVVVLPGLDEPPAAPSKLTESVAAFIDADGDVGLVDLGRQGWLELRPDWHRRMSLDGSYAVATKPIVLDEGEPTGDGGTWEGPPRPDTAAAWDSLPDARTLGEIALGAPGLVPTATQLGGHLVAFTDVTEPEGDLIAGSRERSTIVVAGPDGVRWSTELDGNFEPEAFGRRLGADGLPAQLFLLEYFPADAPTYYRVRVLSLETGEVSLPLNLRDKTQQVDERMAGFSRSQVVSDEHGLLFTLYRGTIDGTPDGAPYAFVHTLDLFDGVWCLDVDARLGLAVHDGAIAVGGDRLYLASANGWVGSFHIPSISDPSRAPEMDWVVQVSREATTAPALVADADGVWIGPADGASRLVRLDTTGARLDPVGLPGPAPTAIGVSADGSLMAAGDGWSTFGEIPEIDWLDPLVRIVVP